jgi:alanyl-tRNA synthetase
MQNIRADGGTKDDFPIVGELPAKNIDTGLGLERTAALLQGVENIYEIDTTMQILSKASELAGVAYGADAKNDVSLRVVADHARTSMMLIGDGVLPGNEGRGYVLRRMMRRTIRNMRILGAPDYNSKELLAAAIGAMAPQYPELLERSSNIFAVTEAEEESFLATLKSGTLIFDLASKEAKDSKSSALSGETVFKLHDTYGFPFDLTLEMAAESGLNVDEDGFRRLMKEQKDRAKADARAKKSGHTDLSQYRKIVDSTGKTQFIGYEQLEGEANVCAILVDGQSVVEVNEGDVEIVLDRTPFYAEGGGQLSDGGVLTLSDGTTIEIEDVQSPVPGLYVHRGTIVSGTVKVAQEVFAQIDQSRRLAISRAHTATHMVHKAFREALGESATQAGSENAPGRFRFDFPANGAVPHSVLNEVEARVNTLLIQNLEVTAEQMSQAQAKEIGAMALFGEKYGDVVRVVSIGNWARELCGGTHVHSSAELGVVKLLNESSIGAGVRRVEALVGADAYSFLAREHILLNSLTEIVKGTRVEELPERISELLNKMKVIEKELASFKSAQALASTNELAKNFEIIDLHSVLIRQVADDISVDDLRSMALDLRNRSPKAVVGLISISAGRAVLVVAVSSTSVSNGIKAGILVKLGSAILGGGGGGKDDFAQGGGTDLEKIPIAIAELKAALGSK